MLRAVAAGVWYQSRFKYQSRDGRTKNLVACIYEKWCLTQREAPASWPDRAGQTGSVPAVAWRLPRLNSICKWKSWGLEPKVMTSFKSVASLCAHSHYRWPRHLAALLPFSGVSPPLSIKACKYKMLVSCLRTVPNSLQFTMIPNGNNKYRNFHGMEWNSNLKKKSRLRILNSIFLSLFE